MKARKNGAAVVFNMIIEASSDQFFPQSAIKELQLGCCSLFVYIFSVNLWMGGIVEQT